MICKTYIQQRLHDLANKIHYVTINMMLKNNEKKKQNRHLFCHNENEQANVRKHSKHVVERDLQNRFHYDKINEIRKTSKQAKSIKRSKSQSIKIIETRKKSK